MNPSTRYARSGQGRAVLLLVPVALMVIGCSRPPEQQFLTQFFRATRARDNTTIGKMSAVEIDARAQGVVEDFSIESIGPERRTPLTFAPLFEAAAKAAEEEKAFLKTKIEYQNANIKAIEQVIRLEADPAAKMTPEQLKIKAEWDKWREGISAHARSEASARAAIKSSTGLAESSLTQPNQKPLDPKTFQGETITKDVVVSAKVKTPDGASVDKTLTITIERVASNAGGTTREGRPIITRITGL